MFAPAVYLAMADEKQAFPATDRMYGNFSGDDRAERRNIFERIIAEKSPPELDGAIGEIVRFLFPHVDGLYTNY